MDSMTKRLIRETDGAPAAPLLRQGIAAALIAAFAVMLALAAACQGASTAGDRSLIPATSPTPRPTVAPAAATPTPVPGSFEVVGGVNVYAEIPPLTVNISHWRETDFRRFTVDPDEIISVGAGRNGIPPIYQPHFLAILEAAILDWMTGDHPVVVVEVNGDARAYPLGIMTFHQALNDNIGGQPVLVTYDPLCYTTQAFSRVVDGVELNFGTTGNVRLSNLIMWDDYTESWWQQADGQAIVGESAGRQLERVPAYVTSFREFARSFPDGRVLSPASGDPEFFPVYGGSQYYGYDSPNNPPDMFIGQPDERLSPTERVLGVDIGWEVIAYPFARLRQAQVINTEIGGEPVAVFWKAGTLSALDEEVIADSHDPGSAAAFSRRLDDRVLEFEPAGEFFRDTETGTLWTLLGVGDQGELAEQRLTPVKADNALWFMWAAFNPETQIWAGE